MCLDARASPIECVCLFIVRHHNQQYRVMMMMMWRYSRSAWNLLFLSPSFLYYVKFSCHLYWVADFVFYCDALDTTIFSQPQWNFCSSLVMSYCYDFSWVFLLISLWCKIKRSLVLSDRKFRLFKISVSGFGILYMGSCWKMNKLTKTNLLSTNALSNSIATIRGSPLN